MGGIRLNEAFGDTMNWDLIPTNAITRADLLTNNPIFGLNALGGAVNIQMKNGFTYQAFEVEALGGSFGRMSSSVQFGGQHGPFAVYVAAQGLDENGWRQKSPTDLGRFYGDIGWRNEATELHLVVSAATTRVGAAAATPIQLLARDWKSVYTTPQTTQNDMGLVALNGKHALSETWSVQGNVYIRGFQQSHVDGNAADIERCSGTAGNPLFNTLCLENEAFPSLRPPAASFQILDQFNQPIPCRPGGTAPSIARAPMRQRSGARCRPPTTTSCPATRTILPWAAASTMAMSNSERRVALAISFPISPSGQILPFQAPAQSSTLPAISASRRSA